MLSLSQNNTTKPHLIFPHNTRHWGSDLELRTMRTTVTMVMMEAAYTLLWGPCSVLGSVLNILDGL